MHLAEADTETLMASASDVIDKGSSSTHYSTNNMLFGFISPRKGFLALDDSVASDDETFGHDLFSAVDGDDSSVGCSHNQSNGGCSSNSFPDQRRDQKENAQQSQQDQQLGGEALSAKETFLLSHTRTPPSYSYSTQMPYCPEQKEDGQATLIKGQSPNVERSKVALPKETTGKPASNATSGKIASGLSTLGCQNTRALHLIHLLFRRGCHKQESCWYCCWCS